MGRLLGIAALAACLLLMAWTPAYAEAPLTVAMTMPANGEASVAPNQQISVVFDRWVNPYTVDSSTFLLQDSNGNPVSGYVVCDVLDASFVPDWPLEYGQTYTATLTTGITDYDGVALASDYYWTFTTGTNRIGDARKLPAGKHVYLQGKALYYTSGQTGYIEEPERMSGIRVEGLYDNETAGVSLQWLSGTVEIDSYGARYIQAEEYSVDQPVEIRPVGASNRALKGDMMTGLMVRAWGKVLAIGDGTYLISDGSDSSGITVYGDCPVGLGEYTAVTGAAGFEGTRVIYALPEPQEPPIVPAGTLVIRWDLGLYNHGQNVAELQIIRDQDASNAGAIPIRAIRDISQWNSGFTDLSTLYGNGPFTVTYYVMPLGSTTPTSCTQPYLDEGYGITHQYQLRALLRTQTGIDENGAPIYGYEFTKFGNYIVATAVPPVRLSSLISPLNGDTLYAQQLGSGDTNFTWQPSVGGDQYRVSVWPVQPGTGPTWTSGVIYYSGGDVMSLPDADRMFLAPVLNEPAFAGTEMYWRVDVRHGGDTSPEWVRGDQAVFHIGTTPPPPPF